MNILGIRLERREGDGEGEHEREREREHGGILPPRRGEDGSGKDEARARR